MPVQASTQPRFACIPCRQHKRKCGREYPACKLCRRVKRTCEYSASSLSAPKTASAAAKQLVSPSPTSDGSCASPCAAAHTPGGGGHDQQNLTAAYFVDAAAYKYSSKSLPRPVLSLPEAHYDLVGGVDSARAILDNHLTRAHRWLPIVSPIRVRRLLADPLPADLVSLLLTMRLLNRPYPHTHSESLYATCKASIALLEAQTVSSINLILANILLASYEIGHAIYPAAVLSVAHCARLVEVAGVDFDHNRSDMLPKPQAHHDIEERRRIKWAVAILDRFILTGIPKHKPVTPDPDPDDLLPTEEYYFNHGGLAFPHPLLTHNTAAQNASPFARACQATHLLAQVIRHLERPAGDLDAHFLQALQIRRTLMPLADLITQEAAAASSSPPTSTASAHASANARDDIEGADYLSALSLVHVTTTLLDGMYTCSQMEGAAWLRGVNTQAMQTDALESVHWTANRVHAVAARIACVPDVRAAPLAPFVVAALYEAALIYQWFVREGDEDQAPRRYAAIVGVLGLVSERWSAAGIYLNVLRDIDATI